MASKAQRAVTGVPAERWAQFGKALQDLREDELGYDVRSHFADERDINLRLVQDLEKSYRPGTYTKFALKDAARAYEIPYSPEDGPGSALAFLRGETDKLQLLPAEPDPASAADPAPPEPARMLPPAPPSGLLREEDARPYFVSIYDRVLELADQGIPDPTGAELGLPPDLADVWDATRGRMSRGDRAWTVAEVQRREAARRDAERDETSA